MLIIGFLIAAGISAFTLWCCAVVASDYDDLTERQEKTE